ncbi:endonuclease/exonuclease/phosphatase family metal-dependent hydrolase [Haloactinopolyspora alba]|uniref:Endonuclease/exonuclease/phosphatase family metal-dependent hydrolase n=1 Tax=Haloactinopolyspora alba TaxID=648780 RepID=A0A2P8DR54_9ACTN|nr:endonuclease/exonuclease/phosphatase family protein [Haloactinopolyspora alba]PSK99698.1 endonuclease/exonuclease/phosphatase family metal-dependent hydrolase [Haloactinopolyspora alba]
MTERSTSLRVVSYNVRGLRDGAGVARVLRELEADVVCLQRMPTVLLWRGRCAALARNAELLYAGGGGTTGGTVLLTSIRVDVRDVQEHRLRRTPGLGSRGAVLARLAVDGQAFGAASMHLGLDAAERARHLTEVTGLVNRMGVPSAVLAGTVNETPDAPTWTRLASQYADAAVADGAVAHGAAAAGAAADGTAAGGAASDAAATHPASRPERRLDGVFVRGGIRVESCRVIDSPDTRSASDHRPVVADLVV